MTTRRPPRKPHPTAQRDRIDARIAGAYSRPAPGRAALAMELGISVRAIAKRAKRLGLTDPARRRAPRTAAQKAAMSAGMTRWWAERREASRV